MNEPTSTCSHCDEAYPLDALIPFSPTLGWRWCANCMAAHRQSFQLQYYDLDETVEVIIRHMLDSGEVARAMTPINTEVWA